jgi:chaperonin GroES
MVRRAGGVRGTTTPAALSGTIDWNPFSSSCREEMVSMKVQPLGDRVVVEREEAKATTAGGIVLPDTAKDRPQKGKVVAVGDGRTTKDGKKRPLQVKIGDSVIFTSYAGDEFKLDGDKKVLLMREDDILAIVEG